MASIVCSVITQIASADQAAITDNTGGTPASQLVSVLTVAVADPAKVNNNFATVSKLLDEIRDVLVNSKIMKGAA